MKRTIVGLVLAVALVAGLAAQATLTKSDSLPKIDGTIGPGEYQYKGEVNGMKVWATLGSDDTLYLAVEAPTSGWVGVGVGGLVMNGSRLFLGAVQDGKPAFIEKAGQGHFYTDAKNLVVKKWAVASNGESTVLELSLPASAAVWKGQVNEILAYSKSASFTSKHTARGKITFSIN